MKWLDDYLTQLVTAPQWWEQTWLDIVTLPETDDRA